ncbi:head GIN domain-containing protein [Microbacterium schleiferi]|uniref:Adhesin domain-containing protein n=1 Tax=Microbacterium schleiferi TaxID=69362 RepID=A0ABU7V7R7_9MICO
MTTDLTPPPSAPAPSAPEPQGPDAAATRGSSTVVAVLLIVFGALIVLVTIVGAVFSTIRAAAVSTETRTAAVTGVDALTVELNAGSLTVKYADVDEAELEVTAPFGGDRWSLERDGDTLTVSSPRWEWGMGWVFGGSGSAVLLLPDDLEGLDAELQMAAGSFHADGEFGAVGLSVGAGEVDLAGAAEDLTIDLSAGRATLDLADVDTADLTVSAGSMDAALTGSQPSDIRAEVSAGSLNLVVPEGSYDVTSDVSAGNFRNSLGSDPGADSTISVNLSAGQVSLRSAR